MATIPTQALRHIQLESNLGPDAFIPIQVQYTEALGQPFQAHVTLACHATDVDFDEILGTNATIAIHNAATARKGAFGYTRHINGFFSSIAFRGHGAEGEALFQATIVPWLWFLTRTSDCRIFQNKSVPEILEEVFRDAGFSDFRKDLKGEYNPREFCVQYRETDFQFVMRLMECEGIYYYFDHENGAHTMVLCDDMVCHKKDSKHEVIRFIGGADAMDRKGCISEWSFSKQVKPGRVALNDFNFKTPVPDPNLRLLARSTAPKTQKPDTYEMYDSFAGYGDVNEGNRYARIRMEQAIADRETAHGTTDIIGLRVGGKFTLERHPIESQNREYLITRVEFMAREATYGSGSGGGGQFFTSSFSCIPMEGTFRPQRTTPLPRIEGPQTATVCGPKGQEIYVDESARVKVQFHWDRYGKADAGSSCWIRVSQPWAGAGFGGVSIPRIGHEVIVEFIEGDPDRPIITGRVYNGSNLPNASNAGRDGKPGNTKPKDMTQAAMMTSFKSNSLGGSGGSNEITMNDAGGAEGLFIKAQKDEIHNVGNDREDEVGNDETRTIGNDRVDTVGNNETRTVGVNRVRNVGANETITIGSMRTHSVGINEAISIGAAQELTIGGAQTVSIGAARITSIGHTDSLTVGKKLTVSAGDEISFTTGKASIVMKKDGTIVIKGKDIKVEGSGQINIKASKDVSVKGKKITNN